MGQEPTLPEVVVEPETGATESPAVDEPVSPVAPQASPAFPQQPSPAGVFDLPASYPNLSQLQFGQPGDFAGNTGILRDVQSLFDMPVPGSIITRQELIERQPHDRFHALQHEVGVLMQRTAAGQASPFIRGVTGQQVLILVDGIRLD
jgi:hypothetical protein